MLTKTVICNSGIKQFILTCLLGLLTMAFTACNNEIDEQEVKLTEYVNTFIGSEPLTDPDFIGYDPPDGWRVWAGLTHPGPALPFAMVQMSPITEFGTGSGYQYEDDFILGFAHTNMGHWNYGHIPVMPVTGSVNSENLGSHFTKENETASPGYYRVLLDDYDITVELTSTPRTGNHRYTYREGEVKQVVFDLSRSNNRVRAWQIEQIGDNALSGYQNSGRTLYFYAEFDQDIDDFQPGEDHDAPLSIITLRSDGTSTAELQIGFSYVGIANAEENFRAEAEGVGFDEIRSEADQTWEEVLQKVQVSGGTYKHKEQLYSGIYRSFLHPHLRSDVNGEYRDVNGDIVQADFNYYSTPALWDTFRNKLVLMGTFFPDVTTDVIKSLIDIGEKRGFLPNYFHGDQASTFITGSYLRGITEFDVQRAYQLMIRNATIAGSPRDYLDEYMERGFVVETELNEYPDVGTSAKASVTKTLEYAYDDFSVALLAEQMSDQENYEYFMERSNNYKNLFDSSTGFMRGKLESGEFVELFDSKHPHYYYQYRESNAWNASFFVPHDTEGLVSLYESEERFEAKLDSLFTLSWDPSHIARNVCCFLGQYMQGNQPSHNIPHLYYFIDKQEKSQEVLSKILNEFYGVGEEGAALPGMDDGGEMSSYYVYNALGFYPYSPAEDYYLISVPLFDTVTINTGDQPLEIIKEGEGTKITEITFNGDIIDDYKLYNSAIKNGGTLVIKTQEAGPFLFK